MKEIGVDIFGQASRGVKESLKDHFAYVMTVSDDSRERSPVALHPQSSSLEHSRSGACQGVIGTEARGFSACS
jgi:hypothetical protein